MPVAISPEGGHFAGLDQLLLGHELHGDVARGDEKNFLPRVLRGGDADVHVDDLAILPDLLRPVNPSEGPQGARLCFPVLDREKRQKRSVEEVFFPIPIHRGDAIVAVQDRQVLRVQHKDRIGNRVEDDLIFFL